MFLLICFAWNVGAKFAVFYTSGPIVVAILYRDDCISRWRSLMGPTKVYKTLFEHPDTIRGKYGLSDTRNCAHGSDSTETALSEITAFFPNFDVEKWLNSTECKLFEAGKVKFVKDKFCHEPCYNVFSLN